MIEKQLTLDKTKLVWLSHTTSVKTPAYGGGYDFEVIEKKQIKCGDSCNTVELRLSNHIGSHVDAPIHFIEDGKTISDYDPHEWIFDKPIIIDIKVSEAEIIEADHLISAGIADFDNADLILIRTGEEQYRGKERYSQSSPGYSEKLYDFLKNRFQSFKAIGMDTISISSYKNRELGRKVHRVFLGQGIRIFEDLRLSAIPKNSNLEKVIALPFRYENSDGSPVTIIGEIGE